jgi:YD repeat-containing protein
MVILENEMFELWQNRNGPKIRALAAQPSAPLPSGSGKESGGGAKKGVSISFQRDKSGRVISSSTTGGGDADAAETKTIHYEYDKEGRMTRQTTTLPGGEERYVVDVWAGGEGLDPRPRTSPSPAQPPLPTPKQGASGKNPAGTAPAAASYTLPASFCGIVTQFADEHGQPANYLLLLPLPPDVRSEGK